MQASSNPGTAPRFASGTGLHVRAVGERALLLETSGTAEASALHSLLATSPLPGQIEAVPAARTVLVRFATRTETREAAARAGQLAGEALPDEAQEPRMVELETVYDGEDLEEVVRLSGLGSVQAVIEAHTAAHWTAAFSGFAPGFAYLTGGDPRLQVPRRSEPRTAVPAGSVALAGEYTAAYPGVSPGGWQLIGRTSAPLWDLEREFPALIAPGMRVRFVPVRERAELSARSAGDRGQGTDLARTDPDPGLQARPDAVVLETGLLVTVQDLGRPGHSHVGVGRSGAADRSALARANRLAGNTPDAAGLEVLFGGLHLRAEQDLVLAVTGASAGLTVQDASGPNAGMLPDRPFLLRAGSELELGTPVAGLRTYIAFRGGLEIPAVLGSRSTDTLAGLGPEPVAPGTALTIGAEPGSAVGHPEVPPPLPGGFAELRYAPGPRQDWFGPDGTSAFESRDWTVGGQSNRVGIRFEGSPLPCLRSGELASEAVLPGSVQVPPSGQPILFLADAPVTGGYPVIGVVLEADLDLAAQLRPGTAVRFVPVTLPA